MSSRTADAFAFKAVTGGTASSISVYLNAQNRATTLWAGLYADRGGHPGSLLAAGSTTSLVGGAWNKVTIAKTTVSAQKEYWIAVLGSGGTLYLRHGTSGSCQSESSSSRTLRLLPSSWLTGALGGGCPLSAYASGTSLPSSSPPPPAGNCDLNATPSTFASRVSAAAVGQTVCLASGNYGTWTGTGKTITVAAASGASPTMQVNFASGDSGFTVNGMKGMGGKISSGAAKITIENSTFSSQLDIEGATTNVVINNNDFTYSVQSTTSGPNSKIFLDTSGSSPGSAVTIEHNDIENGDLDGVHIGGGSGDLILSNRFQNLCDRGINHTDNLQFEGGSAIRIAGNYVYEAQSCPTQGITSYDGGTKGIIIDDNVVDVPRDWGIELYSDSGSTVRHNTVVWHAASYSEFHTGTGDIDIDRKSQDPAGTGTHVYDNVATVSFANGSTGTADHNTNPSTVSYTGGAPGPNSVYSRLFLAPGSPGIGAASDGLDTGIRHSVS